MSEKKSLLRKLATHLWPHAIWDGIHSLIAFGGAAVIAALVAIFQAVRHHWDIWALAAVFLVGSLMLVTANNLIEKQRVGRTKQGHGGHPTPMPAYRTVEEWNELLTHLVPIMNRKFTHEQVTLDGKQFVGCSFVHVNLTYNGIAPFTWQNCDFDEDTKKHFHSQSPGMAQWVELLRDLGMLRAGLNFALSPVEPPQWSPRY